MKPKMFRFSILSVFCLFATISSVFSHTHRYAHVHRGNPDTVHEPVKQPQPPEPTREEIFLYEETQLLDPSTLIRAKKLGKLRIPDPDDPDRSVTVELPILPQSAYTPPTQTPPAQTSPVSAVEESGTPDSGTSEDTSGEDTPDYFVTNIIFPPQETQAETPPAPPLQPIRVTEYMVRDWSGQSGLPQWIELYNPNTEAINLKGYTFQYATRRFANHPYKVHTLTLAATEDGFSIAGGGVAILSTQQLSAYRFSDIGGIEVGQVYNLNIENVLKRGWVLTDAEGREIQRLGRDAFSALRDPVAPPHQEGARISHQVYPSEAPPEAYYYGHRDDVGSPGFYEQPAPSAPSAVIRTRVGTWASLKRTP